MIKGYNIKGVMYRARNLFTTECIVISGILKLDLQKFGCVWNINVYIYVQVNVFSFDSSWSFKRGPYIKVIIYIYSDLFMVEIFFPT